MIADVETIHITMHERNLKGLSCQPDILQIAFVPYVSHTVVHDSNIKYHMGIHDDLYQTQHWNFDNNIIEQQHKCKIDLPRYWGWKQIRLEEIYTKYTPCLKKYKLPEMKL